MNRKDLFILIAFLAAHATCAEAKGDDDKQAVDVFLNDPEGFDKSRMVQIAAALNAPVAYFFKDMLGSDEINVDVQADAALRTFATSRDGLTIIAAWENLKPKMRSVFVDLVRTMAEA